MGSELALIWKFHRPESSFSTTIWWVDEYFGSCKFECPFSTWLCSKLHFRTQICRESPNWSCPSFQIFNLRDRLKFQAWSKFTALNARQQDFSPWTARSRSKKDLRADWCGILTICTVYYSSFCHIFDDYTLTSYIIDPWHVLPYFEFLIELGLLVPFAARGDAHAFFFSFFPLCDESIMSRHSAACISSSSYLLQHIILHYFLIDTAFVF